MSKKNAVITVEEKLDQLGPDQSVGSELDAKSLKKLRMKIDLTIMPFLMAIYFLQYLDKTLLNYAAAMGIKENLTGDEFANLSTIFYVSYLAAEPFAGYLLHKFPVGKFVGCNVFLWGIVVCCHAAAKSYAGLMIVRVLLGIFEAPVASCLIEITSKWWTKPEQSRRTGLWYLQIGMAQMLGSVLSFGFQHVHSTNIASWQILFIFMGILTALVGLLTIFFLPTCPSTCTFLSPQEKRAAIEHVKSNQQGEQDTHLSWYQVKELLLHDKQTWILFFITTLGMVDNGAVSTFSSVIIQSFGFASDRATIIQMPSGAVSVVSTLIFCYVAGYLGQRALIMSAAFLPSILGAILLLALSDDNKVGKLFGVYLLNVCPAMLPMIYNWNSVNTAGQTKRLMRNALTLIAFCVGNLIGPQMFRASDAPHYVPAKIGLIVTMGAASLLCLVLRQVVIRENKIKQHKVVLEDHAEGSEDLTDIQKVYFRYEY